MSVLALPMYDWPEVREATDAWGKGLARHLKSAGFSDVPESLTHSVHYQDSWRHPELLLSQTCGYAFANEFAPSMTAIVTPHYNVDGCHGPNYSSFIMVRSADEIRSLDELRGKRAVFNNRDSMSGMLALKLVFAPLAKAGAFFSSALESGGHIKSLQALQQGRADVCVTDAVCFAMAMRYRPDLIAGLQSIGCSPSVPGLPYITRSGRTAEEVGRMRTAVARAFKDPVLAPFRDALFIAGYSELGPADYAVMVALEQDMARHGGMTLWSE